MSDESKSQLLQGLLNVTEEIIGQDELEKRLTAKIPTNHYIGFEISGLVHLGQGLATGLVIRELQKLGVSTSFFLADWHTWINNKLGGDRVFIKRVADEYFGPALKVSAKIAGANPDLIKINHGSDIYHNNDRYWQSMIDVGKNLTLARVVKSTTIMGREESDTMQFALLTYPLMQAADIFEMDCHIAHAGTDQRKIHVIAREVAQNLQVKPMLDENGNKMKPIGIHHHLALGLQTPSVWPLPEGDEKNSMRSQMKMSKSIEGSAIFIHDTPEEIKNKIKKAFCPEKETGYNPILDWVEHFILPICGEFHIKRDEKFGGSFKATTINELNERFASGDLHPVDLKNNVSDVLIDILEPARQGFSSQESQDLIKQIKEKRSR